MYKSRRVNKEMPKCTIGFDLMKLLPSLISNYGADLYGGQQVVDTNGCKTYPSHASGSETQG